MGGGQGASQRGDGKSGLLFPTSAANTSVELLESRVPVRDPGEGAGRRHRRRRHASRRARPAHARAPAGRLDGPDHGRARSRKASWLAVAGPVRRPAGRPRRRRLRAASRTAAGPRRDGTGEIVTLTDGADRDRGAIAGGSGFGDRRSAPLEAIAGRSRGWLHHAEGGRARTTAVRGDARWTHHDAELPPCASRARRNEPPTRKTKNDHDRHHRPPRLPPREPARRGRAWLPRGDTALGLRAGRQPQDPGLRRPPGGAGARPACPLRLVDAHDAAGGLRRAA